MAGVLNHPKLPQTDLTWKINLSGPCQTQANHWRPFVAFLNRFFSSSVSLSSYFKCLQCRAIKIKIDVHCTMERHIYSKSRAYRGWYYLGLLHSVQCTRTLSLQPKWKRLTVDVRVLTKTLPYHYKIPLLSPKLLCELRTLIYNWSGLDNQGPLGDWVGQWWRHHCPTQTYVVEKRTTRLGGAVMTSPLPHPNFSLDNWKENSSTLHDERYWTTEILWKLCLAIFFFREGYVAMKSMGIS